MTIKDIVAVALFAAFIAVLGFLPPIPVPLIPVPITAQLLGIILAGAVLGAKRGFIACLFFLILVAAGLPLLSGGRGGISVFMSPTTGYLIGFPLTAGFIGYFYHVFRNRLTPIVEMLIMLIGIIFVDHLLGVIWLAYMSGLDFSKALLGDMIFFPGDIVKVVIAYFVASRLRKALPDLMNDGSYK